MRTERRHHRERLKKNRAGYWGGNAGAQAGPAVDTPTPCSYCMCLNPRRYPGERSLQERSAAQELLDPVN